MKSGAKINVGGVAAVVRVSFVRDHIVHELCDVAGKMMIIIAIMALLKNVA
jgi:hypothetical protein